MCAVFHLVKMEKASPVGEASYERVKGIEPFSGGFSPFHATH